MSKLFREWIENVDEDSDEYKKFISQQKLDEWRYDNMIRLMDIVEGKNNEQSNKWKSRPQFGQSKPGSWNYTNEKRDKTFFQGHFL